MANFLWDFCLGQFWDDTGSCINLWTNISEIFMILTCKESSTNICHIHGWPTFIGFQSTTVPLEPTTLLKNSLLRWISRNPCSGLLRPSRSWADAKWPLAIEDNVEMSNARAKPAMISTSLLTAPYKQMLKSTMDIYVKCHLAMTSHDL